MNNDEKAIVEAMSIIKTMSIIGVVIFVLSLFIIVAFMPMATPSDGYTQTDIENAEAAMGWGAISIIWGIAYSITCLVQSRKNK